MTRFDSTAVTEFDAAIADFDAQGQEIPVQRRPGGGQKRRCRTTSSLLAVVAMATTVLALSACGHGDSKAYDIAPIFPLSSNKCSKYGGDASGSGPTSHCYVTKDKCEQAVSDWHTAMTNVPDAIEFSC